MSNLVIWFRPPTLEAARLVAQKFAVYNKLVRGARSFDWGPIYQDVEGPTEEFPEATPPSVFVVEPDASFNYVNAEWPSTGVTSGSNPYGFAAAGNDPLFTQAELATIGLIDIEGMFENYDITG
jgi:hypothetical protein